MTSNEDFEEMYLERARYLLSIDDSLKQILEENYNTIPTLQTSRKISQENNIRIETEPILALA